MTVESADGSRPDAKNSKTFYGFFRKRVCARKRKGYFKALISLDMGTANFRIEARNEKKTGAQGCAGARMRRNHSWRNESWDYGSIPM